jgi:hypothetical protein
MLVLAVLGWRAQNYAQNRPQVKHAVNAGSETDGRPAVKQMFKETQGIYWHRGRRTFGFQSSFQDFAGNIPALV